MTRPMCFKADARWILANTTVQRRRRRRQQRRQQKPTTQVLAAAFGLRQAADQGAEAQSRRVRACVRARVSVSPVTNGTGTFFTFPAVKRLARLALMRAC